MATVAESECDLVAVVRRGGGLRCYLTTALSQCLVVSPCLLHISFLQRSIFTEGKNLTILMSRFVLLVVRSLSIFLVIIDAFPNSTIVQELIVSASSLYYLQMYPNTSV